MVSFQSSYKEVPAWRKMNEGVAPAEGDTDMTPQTSMAEPVLAMGAQTPEPAYGEQTGRKPKLLQILIVRKETLKMKPT